MSLKIAPTQYVSGTLDTGTKTSDSYQPHQRPFDVVVRTTDLVGNLRLQWSHDDGANWDDVLVFTAAGSARIDPSANEIYRLSMAGLGDFTSGSAVVFIGFR